MDDLTYKLVLIGDVSAGKTSVANRYVNNRFLTSYKATLGVDFMSRDVILNNDKKIRVCLWDVAGSDRYSRMTSVYYRGAVGALIVFDITEEMDIESSIERWSNDINNKITFPDTDEPVPIVILANKVDLLYEKPLEYELKMEKIRELLDLICNKNKFISWFETSAKNNVNIEIAFTTLINFIYSKLGDRLDFKEDSYVLINGGDNPCVC